MTSTKTVKWGALLWLFARVVLGMTLLGAALGAVVFPLCGWALELKGASYGHMALTGARTLGFFVGIVWGPGLAVVLCAIRLRRERAGAA